MSDYSRIEYPEGMVWHCVRSQDLVWTINAYEDVDERYPCAQNAKMRVWVDSSTKCLLRLTTRGMTHMLSGTGKEYIHRQMERNDEIQLLLEIKEPGNPIAKEVHLKLIDGAP